MCWFDSPSFWILKAQDTENLFISIAKNEYYSIKISPNIFIIINSKAITLV